MDLAAKLRKTAQSLANHVARGNTAHGSRSLDLIDRYNDLRAEAIKAGSTWEDYCKSKGFDPSHDAYDFFA